MNLNSSIEPILSLSRTNWNQVFRKSNLAFIRVIIDSCCYLLMSRDYEKKRVWPHIKGSSSLVHPSKSSSAVVDIPKKVGKWARDPKRESYFESFPPHPVRAHTNTNLLIPYATDYIMWLTVNVMFRPRVPIMKNTNLTLGWPHFYQILNPKSRSEHLPAMLGEFVRLISEFHDFFELLLLLFTSMLCTDNSWDVVPGLWAGDGWFCSNPISSRSFFL